MAAFTTAQIPSAITSLEQLAVWASTHLALTQQASVKLTTSGEPQPVASVTFGSDAYLQPKVSIVLYLPYDPTLLMTSTGKGWLAAQAVSSVALPSTWTSN
jgi:hypothetical protein